MKSLTLHLFALLPLLPLLLLLQHTSADTLRSETTAPVTLKATSVMATHQLRRDDISTRHVNRRTTSTTQLPPSLHAPTRLRTQRHTTVMTHTATTAATPAILPMARQTVQTRATRRLTPHSNDNSASPTFISPLASPRLVRTAGNNTTMNAHQNRTLLSTAAAAADADKQYKPLVRRQTKRVTQNDNNPKINRKYDNSSHRNVTATAVDMSATPTPPSTASLSPSATTAATATASILNTSRHASVERQSSTIETANTMTNHHNHRIQQRLPKQSGATLMDNNVQRATPTQLGANGGAVNSARLQQTPKTSRMIQRLVAGHIQNAEGHSTYQISVVTTNSTITNSTTLKPAYQYVQSKGGQLPLGSSYHHLKASTTQATLTNTATTTTANPYHDYYNDHRDNGDDEALLEDGEDFDNWDNGILRLSAGSGKENTGKSKKNKEDTKKTLSDQVRDGKYGLIEKEIFRRPPKRPGVLSYLPNKETPADNERNFGGLNEEDIWLAEDHLLVIKGGSLNEDEPNEPWLPIDDYDAPGRQIKLPPNPKVPPPFPVQLEENGPLQFIGNNKFTIVYPVANESIPVYPVGAEANYASSESGSDNEKNLLTRPGSAQDSTQGEPGHIYPAPYPPWIYHNQTFVNPFLNNARPISFPGLGPYPLGRNGSMDNSNGTDYFDEDDPSLYYPPAYSFIYKNNYSNPVPPGPLVPGIVLPPPANQFSRLKKTEKAPATSVVQPGRHRGYGTSSTSSTTTTTTTTTTTSTTTAAPYRPQVITKIHQYTPKTIIITPAPPIDVPQALPQNPTPTEPSSDIIEAIPVPVAVPIPIFTSNKYPHSRLNAINFVPTTPRSSQNTLSKSNPIYYEYFDAKRQRNGVTSNAIEDFLSTTAKPAVQPAKPIKLYATSKRPFKSQPQGQRTYLPPQLQPQRQYLPQNVVYITPKPEVVRYKRPLVPVPVQAPVYKPRPLQNFEQEVSAIRETLRYYQNQQLRDNSIPRTPKAKPVYEFSFDSTKNLEPGQPAVTGGNFQPPSEYDEQPFKPMVTYSPPVDDENAFHAIDVEKVDAQQRRPQQQGEHFASQQQPRYQSSTTLVPVQPDVPYQQTQVQNGRSKKLRPGAKFLQQAPLLPEYRSEPESPQYQSTPRSSIATQTPWISVNQQQELNEYVPPPQQQTLQYQRLERQQLPPTAGVPPKQRGFTGYYYSGPPLHARQNNRFYEEPFQQTNPRRIVNHRQPPVLNYQQPQPQQPSIWSLENDTYVNYAPNRPPLNPDAEFINPYPSSLPLNPYTEQLQRYNGPPPPPLSHQSQYYVPPQPQQSQQPSPQRHYQPQIPLHRDILVNYRQPLPPHNPDSEYISHSQVVRPQAYSPVYRANAYQRLPSQLPQLTATGEQDGLYYIAPKYRRSNNSNANNRNGNNNNNSNNDNSVSNTNTNTPTHNRNRSGSNGKK